jgi:SAM-dependent methyltransferase
MNEFYQDNYKDYHKRTFTVDSSVFLNPFVNILPKNASILDIGCGSGRDLLWLKKQGFYVTGFEQSKGLAQLAKRHAACEIIVGDFEIYDFSPFSFDAILASGSLVHVPHDRLIHALKNIKKALEPGGIFYISLKQGDRTKTDHTNRTFCLWQDRDLRPLFSNLNFEILHFSNSKSVLNSKDPWLGYVLKCKNRKYSNINHTNQMIEKFIQK